MNNTPKFPEIFVFTRIENDLRARIRAGTWAVGAVLPSRKELAKEYGVAIGTVKRAIASLVEEGTLLSIEGRGTFVAETNAARQPDRNLSCLPDILAERLSASATIGIVACADFDPESNSEVGSFWIRLIVRALERTVIEAGGRPQLFNQCPPDAPPISIRQAITDAFAANVDALAVIGIYEQPGEAEAVMEAIGQERSPVAYITWHAIPYPVPHVFYDQQMAGYQAAETLLRLGHRQLIFVAPFEAEWVEARIIGAQNALRHARLPQTALRVFPEIARTAQFIPDRDAQDLRLAREMFASETMAKADIPNAATCPGILTANDGIAYAVLKAASEQGLMAGRDFSLIGFDDDRQSFALGLTTLRPPLEELGVETARLLLRALQGDSRSLQIRLRSHVIQRASTLPRPKP